ncbi:diacylglycerol/lipid kinase family protein [Lutibaculum baratangense]|uniref:Transcription regulator n=1 Tax=Lutibaculum baratangense AMV1 TaxID=631454 RepID=V4RAY5_9HYPH|nr:diacylglycerol kinase family protein [Lutibaculum baratangense]ESR22564.1 Transcription regulator [Lutibaculum baratangense AMV1]
MRIAIIVNEGAGHGAGAAALEARAAGLLNERGHEVVPVPAGELAGRIESARDGPAEIVLVGGGDGTLNLAASLLAGSGKALAIWPLGTANLLARDLRVPLSRDAAVLALSESERQEIDLGEVNGRIFLSKCMIGATSSLSSMRKRLKARLGSRPWVGLLAAFLILFRPSPRLALVAETAEGRQSLRVRVVAVLNNEYDEGRGRVFARSRLDRGLLTMYLAKRISPAGLLRIVGGMAVGRWKKADILSYRTIREITIHSRRRLLHVTVDGDLVRMAPPLRFSVRPKALAVMVPRRRALASGRDHNDESGENRCGRGGVGT